MLEPKLKERCWSLGSKNTCIATIISILSFSGQAAAAGFPEGERQEGGAEAGEFLAKACSKATWSFGLSAGALTNTPSFRHRALRSLPSKIQLQELKKPGLCICHLHSRHGPGFLHCRPRGPGPFTHVCIGGDADIAQVASMGTGRG